MARGQEQTIVITGASRGIGAALAREVAGPGRRVFLVARSEDKLKALAAEIGDGGGHAEWIGADLSSEEGASDLLEELAQRGAATPDVLVLNAGTSNDCDFLESTMERLHYELHVNYLTPASLLHQVVPKMVERGSGAVVVVGSLTALVPFPGNASYAASKAALLSLVRSLRLELAGQKGVHLGAVLPGYTDTSATSKLESVLPKMSAEEVARVVWEEAVEGRHSVVIPGWHNRLAAQLAQAFPETSDRVLELVGDLLVPQTGPNAAES